MDQLKKENHLEKVVLYGPHKRSNCFVLTCGGFCGRREIQHGDPECMIRIFLCPPITSTQKDSLRYIIRWLKRRVLLRVGRVLAIAELQDLESDEYPQHTY